MICANMKLYKRFIFTAVAILAGFILLDSVFFLALNKVIPEPGLSSGGDSVPIDSGMVRDSWGPEHLALPRKDLDKSNYSSASDLSPEGDKIMKQMEEDKLRIVGLEGFVGKHLKSIAQFKKVVPFEPDSRTRTVIDALGKGVEGYFSVDIEHFTKEFTESKGVWEFRSRKGKSLPDFDKFTDENLTIWERFHVQIHQFAMYVPSTGVVDKLMHSIATLPIIDAAEKSGGTQLKVLVTLEDEGIALLKPQRFSRDYETPVDHFYFTDFERHNAEIAAYHLDRVLGFYRVPPVAGRWVNITSDIQAYADKKFKKTFFTSPANNRCFHGTCSYYCDTTHAICGRPDIIEVSLAAFLPPENLAKRKTWRHPWRRSYSKHRKASWEIYDDYCDEIRETPPYDSGRRLLDLMDMAVFDFFIGNMDRHHYETFRDFGNFTFLIHLDHGRSFGKAFFDEMSILAPIQHCCLIRYSTLLKLLTLYHSPLHLSGYMRWSMKRDILPAALSEAHLVALDRRVSLILKTVANCLESGRTINDIVIDDKF